MISKVTSSKQSGLRREDHLLSLPVRRLMPKGWQEAAIKSNYQAAAFAEILNLPSRRLLRHCRHELKCSTKALLTYLQMLAALELLQETARSKEVAVRLGFQTPASFGRRFKAYFGVTPSEFVHRNHHSTR